MIHADRLDRGRFVAELAAAILSLSGAVVKRPIGYGILAVLIGIASFSGLFGSFVWPRALEQQEVVVTPLIYILFGGQVLLGAVTAWTLWKYRRRAPEWYLSWAICTLLTAIYFMRVTVPEMISAMATKMPPAAQQPKLPVSLLFTQMLFYGVLLAAGYWYLVSRRRSAGIGDT
jgi:heme/copper-type cytochrome/quinol oxidase subunit 3